jgi:hypothetical protein
LYQGKQKQPATYYFSRDNTVKKYDLPVHPVFFCAQNACSNPKIAYFWSTRPKKPTFLPHRSCFERGHFISAPGFSVGTV